MGSDNSLATPHKLTKPQIEGLQLGRKEFSPRGAPPVPSVVFLT